MIKPTSLRFRMMALFTTLFGVLLATSYLAFWVFLRSELHTQGNRQLVEVARPVIADLTREWRMQHLSKLDIPNEYFELVDPDGHVLQQSQNVRVPLNLKGISLDVRKAEFVLAQDGAGNPVRAALLPLKQAGQPRVLVVAIPRLTPGAVGKVLDSFQRVALLLFLVGLLLTALISAWYVGRSFAPIMALTQQAAIMTRRVTNREGFWTPLATPLHHDEMGRLAATINHLLETVDTALRQSRQFVTDASHELRTPLSVLRGETELLLSKPDIPEEYRQTLLVFDDELKMLTRIVEGLFTLSMADAGRLRLEQEPLYLNEVLEEVCLLVSPRGRAKQIAITRDLKAEIPYVGDEAFLRELFLIFLDNAIKYSPANTRVTVTLERDGGLIRARFADQGIGIPSEHLESIFQRFYRVESSRYGDAYSGGLGLAIAAAIAKAQGGSISCESELGVGSTFTVTLPRPASTEAPAHTEPEQELIQD
jgi:signal transduction histidine kinase